MKLEGRVRKIDFDQPRKGDEAEQLLDALVGSVGISNTQTKGYLKVVTPSESEFSCYGVVYLPLNREVTLQKEHGDSDEDLVEIERVEFYFLGERGAVIFINPRLRTRVLSSSAAVDRAQLVLKFLIEEAIGIRVSFVIPSKKRSPTFFSHKLDEIVDNPDIKLAAVKARNLLGLVPEEGVPYYNPTIDRSLAFAPHFAKITATADGMELRADKQHSLEKNPLARGLIHGGADIVEMTTRQPDRKGKIRTRVYKSSITDRIWIMILDDESMDLETILAKLHEVFDIGDEDEPISTKSKA